MKKEILCGIPIQSDRYSLLQNIVNKLESGHYESGGIPLENDEAFIDLKNQAKSQIENPQFILVFAKYPKVGFLKRGLLDSILPMWKELPWWPKIIMEHHVRRISKSVNFLDRFEKEIFPVFLNKLREKREKEDSKK